MPYNPPSIIDDVTTGQAANWLTWFEDIYDQAIRDAAGGVSSAGIFLPETYGAIGDDQNAAVGNVAALQACWDAVLAAGGGTMMLGPYTYWVNAPPNQSRYGNSIICLGPTNPTSATPWLPAPAWSREFAVRGFPEITRIRTAQTDGNYSATYGPPSVVGGPTDERIVSTQPIDYHIDWEGVDIMLPGGSVGPTYAGLDLGKFSKANVRNSEFVSTSPTVRPQRLYAFGLRLPTGLNFGESAAHYVNCFGWYCGLVIHSAHIQLHNTISKWCVIGYGIDHTRGADNHAAHASYMESEWCNYHLTGWSPSGGVDDMAAPSQFYITGSWDIEDYPAEPTPNPNPGATVIGDTNGTNVISGIPSTAGITAGMYVVSSLFPQGTTVSGAPGANSVTCSQAAFTSLGNQTFKFGPDWWYTVYHVNDPNGRIFGHFYYQKVRGYTGIETGPLTFRAPLTSIRNLALTEIATQRKYPEGEDVALSGTTITLPILGTFFFVTGSGTLSTVTASWQGRRVTLKIPSGMVVAQAGGNLELQGTGFTALAAGASLTLVDEGNGSWLEAGRSTG